jgi:hypothetical protein
VLLLHRSPARMLHDLLAGQSGAAEQRVALHRDAILVID